MEPRLEAGRVTQGPEFGPGRDQRGLDGVLGQVDVAEDPHRDRQASVADHARQGVERFRVAPLRLLDQSVLHRSLRSVSVGPEWSDQWIERSAQPICSISVEKDLGPRLTARAEADVLIVWWGRAFLA